MLPRFALSYLSPSLCRAARGTTSPCPLGGGVPTIVGGIHEVVFRRILADRSDELPGLADDLLVTILMLDVTVGKP